MSEVNANKPDGATAEASVRKLAKVLAWPALAIFIGCTGVAFLLHSVWALTVLVVVGISALLGHLLNRPPITATTNTPEGGEEHEESTLQQGGNAATADG